MSGDRPNERALGEMPETNRVIRTRRGEERPIWREGQSVHGARMPFERLRQRPLSSVPDLDHSVGSR